MNEIEITKKRIVVLSLIVIGLFMVSNIIIEPSTEQNNVTNGILNPSINSKQLNVKDSTIHIETDPGLSGHIVIYTFNELPNGSHKGLEHTIYFENGTGSFKVNEDPDVKYFAIYSYGHLNQNVGYSGSTDPLYGKMVKITYNGEVLSNSKVYANQFNIDNCDYFFLEDLMSVNDLSGKKIKITN